MLDHPKKTPRLLAALEEAVPFEVELTPTLVKHLQSNSAVAVEGTRHTVSGVSYLGDEGGISCHIVPDDGKNVLVVSITQLQVSRWMPIADDIVDYQKHRIKKIKKQNGM